MLDATVQVDLVRRADVEQQSLEFGPQGRRQETVLVCGKIRQLFDASSFPEACAYCMFMSQFARVIAGGSSKSQTPATHGPWRGINEGGTAYRQWPPPWRLQSH